MKGQQELTRYVLFTVRQADATVLAVQLAPCRNVEVVFSPGTEWKNAELDAVSMSVTMAERSVTGLPSKIARVVTTAPNDRARGWPAQLVVEPVFDTPSGSAADDLAAVASGVAHAILQYNREHAKALARVGVGLSLAWAIEVDTLAEVVRACFCE